MRSEAAYQRYLIERLEELFPGCFVMKNDAAARQGIPDLLILWGSYWGMLEVKTSEKAPVRPNQSYYVDLFDEMSFAAFIHPDIEEQVLHDLQSALGAFR